jgi:lipoate-protein ligase B
VVETGKDCFAVQLGRVEYAEALNLQMEICRLKSRGFERDVLLLLEHPPTITVGRNGNRRHLLAAESELAARKVSVFEADRGGDITFHGPGQLVGYLLLKLEAGERDVHRFMRNLEESLMRCLAAYRIDTTRHDKYTGVWTEQGKIAAMGIHIGRWISRHGFALNVNTDLTFYDMIIPCGIADKGVASMERLLSKPCDLWEIAGRFTKEFGQVFRRNMIWISESELSEQLRRHARQIAVA